MLKLWRKTNKQKTPSKEEKFLFFFHVAKVDQLNQGISLFYSFYTLMFLSYIKVKIAEAQ